MIDVVVIDRETGEEVERIACKGEREANAVLRGIRINMGSGYKATTTSHKEVKR